MNCGGSGLSWEYKHSRICRLVFTKFIRLQTGPLDVRDEVRGSQYVAVPTSALLHREDKARATQSPLLGALRRNTPYEGGS